jgi:hypothetical protein
MDLITVITGLIWSTGVLGPRTKSPRYRQWIEPAINLSCKVGSLGSLRTVQNCSDAEVVATALAWRLQQVPLAPKIL